MVYRFYVRSQVCYTKRCGFVFAMQPRLLDGGVYDALITALYLN